MDRFWIWNALENDPDGEREIVLEGVIDSEVWWGDEVTPQTFREELNAGTGPIVVRINSPGGDCEAAAQIYGMLMEYPGRVVTKIDGLAASAASVVAMAGDEVRMNPVGLMMIHNPSTIAWGNRTALLSALDGLDECRESIVNAYEQKTKLPREQLRAMMDAETWMNSNKALELGFIDKVLYQNGEGRPDDKKKEKPSNAGAQPVAATATGYMVSMRDVRAACLEHAIKRAAPAAQGAALPPHAHTVSVHTHSYPTPTCGQAPEPANAAGVEPPAEPTLTDRDRASFALMMAQAKAALHA